ncbi:hypothetical protein Aperf_G00000055473 [Anoplocephala perfoliata]
MESGHPTEEISEMIGYRRSWPKTLAIWVLITLSGFTLLLFFYWYTDLLVALTYKKVDLSQAEVILLRDLSTGTSVSYVYRQSLITNQVHLYKYAENQFQSESTPLFREENSIRFFLHRNLKYIWIQERNAFVPLNGLDHQCTLDTLSTNPLTQDRVTRLLAVFGPNFIHVPLTPILIKLFREILSPFYVFQIFSVVLWMSDEYYLFASVILVFSVVSVTLSVYSCRKNERQLRDKVQMAESVMVLRQDNDGPRVIPSTFLVPGDIVCIPPQGCDLVADALLISGSCVVNEASLTGESLPQTKSSITELPTPVTEEDQKIDIRRLSRHVLFSGTRVLQARPSHSEPYVKAVVLRTGFLTVKGDLVRAILHPRPLDIDFTLDSFRFLLIMAVIAIAGSVYTWIMLYRLEFSNGMLLRKSLDILTIVVPPALPAVMTSALYFAQTRLKKLDIFCINPSAVNIAGTLNTVVFDKTGTLTEENISVKGIWRSGLIHSPFDLIKIDDISNESGPLAASLAACHCLSFDPVSCEVVGDPLDKVIFTSINWSTDYKQFDAHFKFPLQAVVYNPKSVGDAPWSQLGILRHFPFSSTSQRQSVVVETALTGEVALLCKGAPELIVEHCEAQTVPSDFERILQHFTEQGYRALALAWKPIEIHEGDDKMLALSKKREELESDLRFLGLVVLNNPLKPETEPTIKELLVADFRVIMATGDNPLTSVSVARQCGIIGENDVVVQVTPAQYIPGDANSHNPLNFKLLGSSSECPDLEKLSRLSESLGVLTQLSAPETPEAPILTSGDQTEGILFNASTNIHLVLTGTTWNYIRIKFPRFLPVVLSYGTIFARFLPDDKTNLIRALQTFDEGANSRCKRRVAMCGDGANDCGALKAAAVGIALSDCEASISAPLTSRQQNITCVTSVLKEGRNSLSTAIGSFKYIVLCSFIQFLTVVLLCTIGSVLTDPEYLIIDLFIVASLSVTYSTSRPWKHLEPSAPPLRLLTPKNLASVLIHLTLSISAQLFVFLYVRRQPWWKPYNTSENVFDVAGSYETTALFYFSCFQYIFVCLVLAKGPPFQERVYRNRVFSINVLVTLAFLCGFILSTPAFFVNWAQLLPLHEPNAVGFQKRKFALAIIIMAVLYLIAAWGAEKVIDKVSLRRDSGYPTKRRASPTIEIVR